MTNRVLVLSWLTPVVVVVQRFAMLALATASLATAASGCSGNVATSDDGDGSDRGRSDDSGDDDDRDDDDDDIIVEPPEDFEPLSPVVHRLTREEYAYTIKDVLGVDLTGDDLEALPADRPLEGFVNIATSQAALPDHVLGFDQLAEDIAARIDADGFIDEHADCRKDDDGCRQSLVEGMAAVLFRRPATQREVDVFAALFADVMRRERASRRALA